MNPGDSNEITRQYLDSILLKTRYIDSDLPDLSTTIFGRKFDTPITTAALSHLEKTYPHGMSELAKGAKAVNALNFCGMESYDGEIADILEQGAATIRFIKPHANNEDVYKRIEQAKKLGAFGVGMDIDHAFNGNGGYDNIEGLAMKPKSQAELKSFVEAAGDLPFVVKGILSVEDALKCVEIGAAGIVVSHHHGIMPYSAPPAMVLPEIAEAVAGRITIFADCCVATGMDVYKLLALGADAVCLGRVLLDPLHNNGAQGVSDTITALGRELASTMARTGFKSIAELDDTCIV